MNDTAASSLALALAATSALIAPDALAQSCANPQHVFANSTISGSTCGTNALPALNHGTIQTPGDDAVFLPSGGLYGIDWVRVTAGDDTGLVVFVCTGCGPNAECVASGAASGSGFAEVAWPDDDRSYYVIVDSLNAGCHDFQLSVTGPLAADP
jgi:hypothetical protein